MFDLRTGLDVVWSMDDSGREFYLMKTLEEERVLLRKKVVGHRLHWHILIMVR